MRFPPSLYRPPPRNALPPLIVIPEIDAVTPPSIWNTRLAPPPLTVTPAFGPVIVSVPVISLSSSWPRVGLRVIVCGVLKTVLSNVIVSLPPFIFAWLIAWRRSIWPATGVSVGLLTTIVRSTRAGCTLTSATGVWVGLLTTIAPSKWGAKTAPIVDSSLRSSSAIKVACHRRRCRRSTVPGLRLRGSLTRFLGMVLSLLWC